MDAAEENRRLFAEAVAEHGAGRFGGAEKLYRTLLARNPNITSAHNNLGMLLVSLGRPAEAEQSFRDALTLRPDYPEALNNLGILLHEAHADEEAIECFRRAIELQPDNVEALINMADVVAAPEAHELYATAQRLSPSDPRIDVGLSRVLVRLRRREEALLAIEKAVHLSPGDYGMRGEFLMQCRTVCDWRPDNAADLIAAIRTGQNSINPWIALHIGATAADQLACAVTYAATYFPPRNTETVPLVRRDRIRIGYLSYDLRDHAVASLLADTIDNHDRNDFEIVGYSFGPDDSSAMRTHLMESFDLFVDLASLSDAAAAERIRRDGIDVLVDLGGYTEGSRTGILAFRPAPIQVNYLGYPGTMGASYYDYIIADDVLIPEGDDVLYSEYVVRLPGTYQPAATRVMAPQEISRATCDLDENAFVFCCFNRAEKLNPAIFACWMQLLHNVPDAVLWLLEPDDLGRKNLLEEAQTAGIAPWRIIFAPRMPWFTHLARYTLADLFLDTTIYNAHTTMSDALWAGLPAITCIGSTFAGRVGASLLRAAGLPDMVTENLADYAALARRLATDPAALGAVRSRLKAQQTTAPPFDVPGYTRHLESAYRAMRDNALAGHKPRPIRIS